VKQRNSAAQHNNTPQHNKRERLSSLFGRQ
jgi:hypothetical protein